MGLEVRGLNEAQRMLEEQAARIRAPGPVLVAAAADLEELVDASTRQGRAPDGTPWAPPVTTTRATPGRPARARHDRPSRQLGRLPERTTFVATARGIEVSNPSPVAGYTQDGTSRQPARRIVPTRATDAGGFQGKLGDRIAHYVATGAVR